MTSDADFKPDRPAPRHKWTLRDSLLYKSDSSGAAPRHDWEQMTLGSNVRMTSRLIVWAAVCVLSGLWAQAGQRQDQRVQQEEAQDYFAKWLREDVTYIITPEEREVFQQLSTPEEKEQFIEQFWYRRDPDFRTPTNEFKLEHYRRLAYANERFTSGVPGWKTDRGRIYIIHGPPVEIQKFYSGQSYERPAHEGGGMTSVVPFEIWRYHHIEGLGPDVEIEFVDPTRSGEFRLARNPWEKDELLVVPGAAPTTAESLGLMERGDHPYFTYTNRDQYPGMSYRAIDNPFTRYERLVKVQAPPDVKYRDLKELVTVDIRYENLAFATRQDYFQLNESAVLAALTLEIQNRDLTFQLEDGIHVARIALYGVITSLSNRIITEFEQDLMVTYAPEDLQRGLTGRSVYQRVIPVERGTRYRVDLVVKDVNSGNVGVQRRGIIPPPYTPEGLSSSTLLISDHIVPMKEVPEADEPFVIGDVKIRPSIGNRFTVGEPLGAYLHVYNAGLDQASLQPHLRVRYELLRGDEVVGEGLDERGGLIQFFSSNRVVLIMNLPVEHLPPDRYRLRVSIEDRVSRQQLTVEEFFQLEAPASSD